MMVDVAIYMAGLRAAEFPDDPLGVTETEDLIRWVFDKLAEHQQIAAGEIYILSRVDGTEFDDDIGGGLYMHVVGINSWDSACHRSGDAAEYAITRYVPVHQVTRWLPFGEAPQMERLPL